MRTLLLCKSRNELKRNMLAWYVEDGGVSKDKSLFLSLPSFLKRVKIRLH